jgi:predicted DNA-binding transcriptional regulator AlpA
MKNVASIETVSAPQTESSAIDPYGRFLKLADVMQSIGVSQAMVYKLMHDERKPFPRPVKIGKVSVWIERDVVIWKAIVAGDRALQEPASGIRS